MGKCSIQILVALYNNNNITNTLNEVATLSFTPMRPSLNLKWILHLFINSFSSTRGIPLLCLIFKYQVSYCLMYPIGSTRKNIKKWLTDQGHNEDYVCK